MPLPRKQSDLATGWGSCPHSSAKIFEGKQMEKDYLNEDGSIDWEKYNIYSKNQTIENLKRIDERMKALEKRIEERNKNVQMKND
jgi:hypothetical protein